MNKNNNFFQTVLQEILGKFDLMEQRMAVIKKYAKYGQSSRNESTPTTAARSADFEGKTNLFPFTLNHKVIVSQNVTNMK